MTTWLFDAPPDTSGPCDVLDITVRFEGGVTVFVLTGPLCAFTAPSLDEWLRQLGENGRHKVIIDARAIASLSSDGVDVLVEHADRCRRAGGDLQVRAPSTVARRVLDLCDAEHLVEPRTSAG
jgi:anti-anti-sigma factor